MKAENALTPLLVLQTVFPLRNLFLCGEGGRVSHLQLYSYQGRRRIDMHRTRRECGYGVANPAVPSRWIGISWGEMCSRMEGMCDQTHKKKRREIALSSPLGREISCATQYLKTGKWLCNSLQSLRTGILTGNGILSC